MSIGGEITEEYYEDKVLPKYKNLIETQRVYVEFLEKEVTKYATTSKYQISAKDFNYGQQLRDQIEEMSANLEK